MKRKRAARTRRQSGCSNQRMRMSRMVWSRKKVDHTRMAMMEDTRCRRSTELVSYDTWNEHR